MLILLRRIVLAIVATLLALLAAAMAYYAYASTRTNASLVSSGETRHYLLHVPQTYDAATPAPLVISLHGAYLYPRFQMRLTEWNALAEHEGFIVVYPKAAGLLPLWRMQPGRGLVIEVQFFRDLVAQLSSEYNIDQDRIYVNGFSNGAAMTFMLSCELGDRIAAFGMVATPVVSWDWCMQAEPVPMFALHGLDDPFAPYAGGTNFLTTQPLQGIRDWAAEWSLRNRCEPTPRDNALGPLVTLRQFGSCARGTAVALYSVQRAGHVWPGGMAFPGNTAGGNSEALDATEEMWRFFARHPLTLRR